MDKYLFIDFDGVLNTENYTKFLQTNGFDSNDKFGTRFDPDALQNLKAIRQSRTCSIMFFQNTGTALLAAFAFIEKVASFSIKMRSSVIVCGLITQS